MDIIESSRLRACSVWLKSLFLFVLFCTTATMVGAQEQQIKGCVKSATDGEPLIGVSVRMKGTGAGVVTDIDGNYLIKTSKGKTLVFSYMGYKPQEIVVGEKSIINISLSEDAAMLNDVVVVGYGTMKRSDLTGSTVSVSGDDIKKSMSTSIDQALQGRAAGVEVTQNSGTPGGGISVSIRGTNSLNGNEPLYVVDGVAINGQTDGNTSALSSINPSDIVSMEVLKDASATAIYGSRASNGVVLITTRHGESNKTHLSYEGYVAWQTLPQRIDVMNLSEYARFYNQRAEVLGYGSREDFNNPDILGNGTDWQDEIYRTALMHNHQVSLSGGSDKVRYAVSGGYLNHEGIVIGSDFNRFTTRINLDMDVAKWMKAGINTSIGMQKQTNTIENDVNSMDDNVLMLAIRQYPDVPARNADGSYGYVDTSVINTGGTPLSNPVSDAMTRERYTRSTDVMANAFADFMPLKGLDLRIEYGTSFNFSKNYRYTPYYDFGTYTQSSESSRTSSQTRYSIFKVYATYNTKIGKHGLNIMAGHEAQESRWETLEGSRKGYEFNSVHELPSGDASTAKNNSGVNETAIESYFGRLNYNYDDRYLLTATLRADGSSAFGPSNRWGWFPSTALAWRVSNESFMKKIKAIDNLKLRLGWGLVGNQNVGSYAYGAPMATVSTIWGTGYYMSRFSNSNLKWESTNSYNIGFDLSLLNNRLQIVFDAYYKKTDNLLMNAPLPSYVIGGATADQATISSPWVNVGAMKNKGFEFTISGYPISKKDLQWNTSLTFSLNRNEVTKLYTESSGLSGILGNQIHTYTQVGTPVGQFYGYVCKGMFTTEDDFYMKDKNGDYMLDANGNKRTVAIPEGKNIKESEIWYGDYIWEDLNGDGVINEKDRTYIGNPEPKFTLGWNNTINYKNFDLSFFIYASVGGKVYNYLEELCANPYNKTGQISKNKDFAQVSLIDANGERTLDNMYVSNPTTAQVQRITASDANTNNRVSDRFVEDGSYLRMKTITLGYTLPQQWLKKMQLSNLRIYASVQNAFVITGYSGYDPEIGAYNQDVKLRGIDFARYPSPRTFTFGINIAY